MKRVRDLVKTGKEEKFVAVQDGQSLLDVVKAMAGWQVESVMVMRGAEPVGIITERDIINCLAEPGRIDKIMAGEKMSCNLCTVSPGDSVAKATMLMRSKGIRHLPVVEDGKITGMLSLRDIAMAEIDDLEEEMDLIVNLSSV